VTEQPGQQQPQLGVPLALEGQPPGVEKEPDHAVQQQQQQLVSGPPQDLPAPSVTAEPPEKKEPFRGTGDSPNLKRKP